MRSRKRPSCSWLALAALAAASSAGCAGSHGDLGFFAGKTVTIVVPHGPGGMDSYARSIAPYLQKHIPGSKVIVANVPGNGSIEGRNRVYLAAPDGLTLGFTTSAGSLLAEWAGQPDVKYETEGFALVGRMNAETHVMVASPKSGLGGMPDIIRAKRIVMGFAGVGSDDYYVALASARLLGYRVDARTAYTSSSDAGLACVIGQVDAILFSDSSVRQQIDAQTLVPLAVFSQARLPSLPSVPTIFESIPPGKRSVMRALVLIYELDRTLFAPPRIPAGRLIALRGALDAAAADPDYLMGMASIQRPVSYMKGADAAALLGSIISSADQIKPLISEIAGDAK